MSGAGRRAAAFWSLLAAAAVAAGTWLRVHQLDLQLLIDDEWHAVHRLLGADAGQILTRLGYADYSIPMTVYFRGLYEHGALSERAMHAPTLVAGIALLVAGPWLLRRWTSWPVLATWMALAAVSPMLVYHSKLARPYALTVLLALVAIVTFRRYWLERDRRFGVAYVAAAWLCGYLHLVTLPFVLMPLAYYGVPALRRAFPVEGAGSDREPLRRALVIGGALAILLAVAVLPPVVNDWQQFAAKALRDHVTMDGVLGSARLLGGSAYGVVAVALIALAAYGWRCAYRRDRDLARYVLVVNAVAAVAIAASGSLWISHSLVYARYLLPGLPFLLWLAAEGIVRLVGRLPAALGALAAFAIAAGLYVAGPIPAIDYFPNQFWGHARFQFDYDPDRTRFHALVPRVPVPAFHQRLAKLPRGSVTIAEAPWYLESYLNPYSAYQEVHGQFVKGALLGPLCKARRFGEFPDGDPGLGMRHLVHVAALLRSEHPEVDYLVLHRRPWPVANPAELEWPDVEACLSAIEAALGPPVDTDGDVVVFALSERARRLEASR